MRISAIDAYSTYLFHQGTNYSSYRLFGAHLTSWKQKSSVRFCVWAPHARAMPRRRLWNEPNRASAFGSPMFRN